MKIDIVIDANCAPGPGGAVEVADDLPRLPAFEALVARGEPIALGAVTDLQSCLLQLFDADPAHAPIAALTLLGDGGTPGDDYWLRVDPVSLIANRSHLVLVPLPDGDLPRDEAAELAATIAPHLAADGYELVPGHPQRWYLRCTHAPQLETRSPLRCAGELAADRLPAGTDAAYWRRLITEAQMLMLAAAANGAREARGKLPVNGIWPWGGGRLAAPARAPYQQVFSDDPLARGLGRAGGAVAAALPPTADAAIASAPAQAALLIVVPMHAGTAGGLERDWLQPLASALRDQRVSELRLLWLRRPHSLGRRLTRAHLKRWWRRVRPIILHA